MSKLAVAVSLLLKDLLSQKKNRLIMFAIGCGAFFMVVGGGYNSGMKHQLLALMRAGYTGDAAIVAGSVKLEPNPMPLQVGREDLLPGEPEVLERVRKDPNVQAVLERLVVYGNVMGKDDVLNEYATIVGCNFQAEEEYTFRKLLVFTEEPRRQAGHVYVSKKIADKLGLQMGGYVYLFLVDQNNMLRPSRFLVGGIFTGKGFPAVVEGLVYVDYADLKDALGLPVPYYSSLLVFFKDQTGVDATFARLRALIPPGWRVVPPADSGSFFQGIYNMIDLTTMIANFLMYLSIFLFVYSILLLNITGRRREIGIMKALGVSNLQTFLIFVTEGALLGLVPAALGTILGLFVVLFFSIVGIPALNEAMKYMFASDVLYFRVNTTAILNALIIIPFMAFLGAVFPTCRVLKLKPVEALKQI